MDSHASRIKVDYENLQNHRFLDRLNQINL